MTNTNILQKFFIGASLLALFVYWGCSKQAVIPDTNNPSVTPLNTDSLLGQHIGTCYHYSKYLSTGVESWDTTYGSILDFSKVDSNYTRVSGCGGNNNISLPDVIDTVYHYSGFVGSQSYYWEIRISNIDKTIATQYKVTSPGGAPFIEQYDGKWNL